MNTKELFRILRYAAIFGNILFILWVVYNAIDDGFNATMPEKFSAIGLIGLLTINCILLITKFSEHQTSS